MKKGSAKYTQYIKQWSVISTLALGLAVTGCSTSEHATDAHDHHQMPQYHVGSISPDELLTRYSLFAENKASDSSKITELEVLDLANQLNNRKMVVVFGTWCHDSQREVPRLLNLIDKVRKEHPEVKFELEMIAAAPYQVRDKTLIEKYELTAVPTIMLFDNDQEIGRVVETTKISLAADIVNMRL